MSWTVEFYEDDEGHVPAREFMLSLSFAKRAAAIAAVEAILAPMGLDVCKSEYGRPLGSGLYEFRLRHDEKTILSKAGGDAEDASTGDVLLRFFFAAHGQRIILLLGGYDKGRDSSPRRQSKEIQRARRALRSFNLRLERQKAAARRRQ